MTLPRIVAGQDARVAAWMFEATDAQPMTVNAAIGLEDEAGKLVGGIAFTDWNGSNAEVHFVGPGTLTRRTVRIIMGFAILQLNLNRLTVHTRKETMSRGVQKLGAVFECNVLRLYGSSDEPIHMGKRWVFFRETIEKLAGLKGTR